MTMGSIFESGQDALSSLKYIPQSYNNKDATSSVLRLIFTLRPDWQGEGNKIDFVRFTDGITNTLLKIVNRRPEWTENQIENEAVLMRAYGNYTELIIDRQRETKSHALLATRGLAPALLARFQNGLLYRFCRGHPTTHLELAQEPIWRGVARRLGQWHAVLPIDGDPLAPATATKDPVDTSIAAQPQPEADFPLVKTRHPGPNLWTTLQKWILVLPTATEEQRTRQLSLQKEFERVVQEFDDGKGIGEYGLVFAHCDLLCANVIVSPTEPGSSESESKSDKVQEVHFIDYEYANPSPAAFDLANHFAEWAGYDCDYSQVPTKSVRRAFLREYVQSYRSHRGIPDSAQDEMVDQLYDDVERFRGIPGLYWGVWALIQSQISQIDFDYASYAEHRFGEYTSWRREQDGSRVQAGEEMPLRERRWAEE